MKKKTISKVKKVKKELDRVFSIYIRQKYMDHRGNIKCVTCNATKPLNEMQCGHYVGRANMSVRYDERNCHPQCVRCNIMMKGNYPAYTEFLVNKHGSPWLLNLIKEGRLIRKWTMKEMEELISFYKEKI